METGVNMLVNELTQGFERARELEAQLSRPSIELCQSLVQDILASFEKAVSMAKSSGCPSLGAIGGTDSPRCFTESPGSENPEQPLKAERKAMVCKKRRRTQPKWTSQVKLGSGPDAEGPLDDGCSWRKYGQKEILGAKHPRGYYRCSHRNSQGCLAMRQVQQSNDNPAIFEVTYRGTHTCRRMPVPSAAAASSFPSLDHHNNQLPLLSFQTNLRVETENLDSQFQDPAASSSFSFPSTPIDGVKPDSHEFSPVSTLGNCFKRSYADAFVSVATSESNYFPMSPCTMSKYGGAPSLQASESNFAEIVSAVTLASPSSMLDSDFLLQWSELDPEIPLFDTSIFFS